MAKSPEQRRRAQALRKQIGELRARAKAEARSPRAPANPRELVDEAMRRTLAGESGDSAAGTSAADSEPTDDQLKELAPDAAEDDDVARDGDR